MNEESMDRYELRPPFMSSQFSHPLSKAEYLALKAAKDFLLTYMAFEETVLQVLYASQNFEEYLLRGALDFYLLTTHEFDYFQDMRLKANLYVVGVLNSVTGFRDQFPTFKGLTGSLSVRSLFVERWSQLLATSVALQFGEALRNYAQHKSQPVSGATTGGGWDEGRTLMESHLTVYADVAPILSDRRVGRAAKAEFERAYGEKADLALILREMLGAVGTVTKQAREDLKPYFDNACSTYERELSAVSRYVERLVVADAALIRSGSVIEKFGILEDFLQRA
ncbi:MAG: hypothetical protein ABL866_07765 [Devosia sp.]